MEQKNQNLPQRHNTPAKTVQSVVYLSNATANFLLQKPQQEQTILIKNKILLTQSNNKLMQQGARYVEKGCHTTNWLAVYVCVCIQLRTRCGWPIRLNSSTGHRYIYIYIYIYMVYIYIHTVTWGNDNTNNRQLHPATVTSTFYDTSTE